MNIERAEFVLDRLLKAEGPIKLKIHKGRAKIGGTTGKTLSTIRKSKLRRFVSELSAIFLIASGTLWLSQFWKAGKA